MSFVIVDAYGFLFRAYHSLPPLTNPNGQNVGAIYGMLNMLYKLINDKQPSHIVIALDSGRRTFRHDIFADYKSNRPAPPDDLKVQFKILQQMLEAAHLPHIAIDGVEADDIIASIAIDRAKMGDESIVISSDKDLLQLLQHDNIKIYDAMKAKYINNDTVQEKFGVSAAQMLDYLSMVGDASDFVPGVAGVGAKTASSLLQEYGSIEGIYDNLEHLKPRQIKLMTEGKENAFLSRRLISLKSDLNLHESAEKFKFQTFSHKSFAKFLKEMGFESLLKKFSLHPLLEGDDKMNVASDTTPKIELRKPLEIEIKDIDNKLISRLIKDGTVALYINDDVFKISSSTHALCIKLQIQTKQQEMFLDDNTDANNAVTAADVLQKLEPLLADKGVKILTIDYHNLGIMCHNYNLELCNFDDLNVMSYMLYCGKFKHEGDAVLQQNDLENSAEGVLYCYNILYKQLFQHHLLGYYLEIERKVPQDMLQMEHKGVYLDTPVLQHLTTEFSVKLSEIEVKVFELAGEEFNIASPKQLGHILFDKLNIPGGKRSKSGAYVTHSEKLEDLEEKGFEICKYILEWRQLSKLINTYTASLPKYLGADQRLHSRFQITNTSTGRFSSQDPNLQNIPIRTQNGALIRKAFAAKPGHQIIAADYSQIELRLLAHIADIDAMKQTITSGGDIHQLTAEQVFGSSVDANNAEVRRQAKAINFGIIYGISAFGLAKRLGISNHDAKSYINQYFERFPGIKQYMDNTIEEAKKQGFVTTLFNRRCYVQNINNKNHTLRSFAERAAINAPLQGTAAEIIKRAMVLLPDDIKQYLILQIHDELLFEVPDDKVDKVTKIVRNIMQSSTTISIPLDVDVKYGSSWFEAK